LEERFLAHERDERWVYVALAILAIAYVVYRYWDSIDLPAFSFRGLRKLGTTLPYVLATFFGVFFQAWNRRRVERIRKRWEADLALEGVVRQREDVSAWHRGRKRESFQADIYMTGAALYVFDRARKRDPMRLTLGRGEKGGFVGGAALVQASDGGPRRVRVLAAAGGEVILEFTTPDADGWWMAIRRALRQPADLEAELAAADVDEGSGAARSGGSMWEGIVGSVREEIGVRREP
jgi:hypothetical protein